MKITKLFLVILFSIAVTACGGGGGGGGGGVAQPAISALATAYAETLSLGTAITSFSPLTVSGGATPYTYSYTGTLVPGLNFNTSTGVISGTPSTPTSPIGTPYNYGMLIVSVKDANNVAAKTTSTVQVSVYGSWNGSIVTVTAGCSTAC